jgi:DNA-binding CsgD family transcriptional regulator
VVQDARNIDGLCPYWGTDNDLALSLAFAAMMMLPPQRPKKRRLGQPLVPSRRRLETRLSPRERELLVLLSKGLTYRESALAMAVGPETVKTMAKRILRKYDMSSMREVIAQALRQGNIV